ncbi:hypothetical protein Ple7327_0377 [Pleurocapsa sp. PCC 7327]|uniref:hypothetical protein n=1 Tax=Pleurocapsa sp. PCC 7327 TaxID=118163 RepID=UPI00029FC3F7|nr:hypothetical protein [Pleurocapsa sp. PCC 7327]AFY75837.1 hypothetical protein Ple7327_0377 [Pleurocapsa sp. PCC 7327]
MKANLDELETGSIERCRVLRGATRTNSQVYSFLLVTGQPQLIMGERLDLRSGIGAVAKMA